MKARVLAEQGCSSDPCGSKVCRAQRDRAKLYAALDAVEALADEWETLAGPGTEADRVFGRQGISVEFAVKKIRAAIREALGEDA
jgi:hypothetical protein